MELEVEIIRIENIVDEETGQQFSQVVMGTNLSEPELKELIKGSTESKVKMTLQGR